MQNRRARFDERFVDGKTTRVFPGSFNMLTITRWSMAFLIVASAGFFLAAPVNAQRRNPKPKQNQKQKSNPNSKKTARTVRPNSSVAVTPKFQVDGDRVTMTVANGVAKKVRISLSENGADWWRGIKVIDKNGNKMLLERQEGLASSTNVLQLDRGRFDSTIKIEFWKAKLFGAHTYMTSETYNLNDFLGKTVTFTWYEGLPKNDNGQATPVNSNPIDQSVTIDGNKSVTLKTTDNLRGGQLDRGTVKIRMDTAASLTWWKGVKVVDSRGNQLWIEKQDKKYSTSDTIEVDRGRFGRTIKIELWVAKAFGVHTYMKTVTLDTERLNGRTLAIEYTAD